LQWLATRRIGFPSTVIRHLASICITRCLSKPCPRQANAVALDASYDVAVLRCDFLNDYPDDLSLDSERDFVDDRSNFTWLRIVG
jgi:hypothetical protein